MQAQIRPNIISNEEEVEILLSMVERGKVNIEIVNIAGQVIYRMTHLQATSGETSIKVPTINLENGLYLVCLEFENQKLIQKMVVSR